jgi:FtsP/CotA-like multicopper oxidase with cupredoxin domain
VNNKLSFPKFEPVLIVASPVTFSFSFLFACCLLAASPSSWAARPVFQGPRVIEVDAPLTVLATSPKQPQRIDGFRGEVSGLFLYGINGELPSLRPATWRTEPGKTLQFSLQNDLPCIPAEPGKVMRPDQTNMHVHGLIVYANDRDREGRYGDNSMMVLESGNSIDPVSQRYRCGARKETSVSKAGSAVGSSEVTKPNAASKLKPLGNPLMRSAHAHEVGSAQFKVTLPADHPYGLSWYHPHVHEVSGYQVGGGMSGLIEIGDVWSYAYAKYSPLEERLAKTLDVPEAERAGRNKSRLDEEQALRTSTRQVQLMLKDLQLVRTSRGSDAYRYTGAFVPDLCGAKPRTQEGVCHSADGKAAWLFTVNGQVLPELKIEEGERHVWRVANVSATLSYRLQLRVVAPKSAAGTILPLQVLGGDGVAFRQSKASANMQSDFVMLPSARLDLAVDPLHICRKLKKLDDRAGVACTMDDVEAVLETTGPNLGADQWPAADLVRVSIRGIKAYRSQIDPGPLGVAKPQQVAVKSNGELPPVAPACDQGVKTLASNQYRLIGVLNDGAPGKERFAMATEGPYALVNDKPGKLRLAKKSYLAFDPGRLDLCIWADIKNKYFEHWVIKNDSKEVHNFHLHQAKFEVLDHSDGKKAWVASRASGSGVLHDNYPINPGGWIMLKITFDRPEQAGRYMYHCHILEHEDKGMMSMIQVVDTSAGLRKDAAFKGAASHAKNNEREFAAYLASVPPWMRDNLCRTPR